MYKYYQTKMNEKHMDSVKKLEIRECLEEELTRNKRSISKKFNLKPAALCAGMLLLFLVSGTVAFAHGQDIMEWIHGLGRNSEIAESYVLKDSKADNCDNEPWLTLQDVYVDGSMLVFTARLSDGCETPPINIRDHAIINDVDCATDSFASLGNGVYQGVIFISDELLNKDYTGQKIKVVTRLITNNENIQDNWREFSFTIPGDTMNLAEQNTTEPIMLVETDDEGNTTTIGNVVADYRISPSRINMKLTFTFYGEDAKENAKKYINPENDLSCQEEYIDYLVEDDKGNINEMSKYCFGYRYINIDETQTTYSQGIEIDFNSFPCDSEIITFIPYGYHVDENGKPINEFDSEGNLVLAEESIYEERSITIPLKYQKKQGEK